MTKKNDTNTSTTPKMTAYQVAKAANAMLKAKGLKEIPPQMVYTYVRKGYIASVVDNGQQLVENAEAARWISEYITKKLEKAEAAKAPAEEPEELEELEEPDTEAFENEGGAVSA